MKSPVDPFSKPGHVIRRLQQYAVLIFHEETAGFDLTPTQYVTLQVVEHRPASTRSPCRSSAQSIAP